MSNFCSRYLFLIFLLTLLTVMSCGQDNQTSDTKTELLIYCGITMVDPIREIADHFEKKHLIKIIISQGGSEELYQSIDSRTLNRALKSGDADVILNWKATAFFQNNRDFIDIIAISPDIATPKRLTLNFLKISNHPDMAKAFMKYAQSPMGLSIFEKFGFSKANNSQ